MEFLRAGSPWFLGVDTWNNLDDSWCCDESVPELFREKLLQHQPQHELMDFLYGHRTGQSDWNYCLVEVERLLKNLHKERLELLLEERMSLLRQIRDEEISKRMFTKPPLEKEQPSLWERWELFYWRRLLEDQMEREICSHRLENLRERLRKVQCMLERERLDMERLWTMLPLISSRNIIFTARVSAEAGIYMKMIVNHVIHYLATYLRSFGKCGLATSFRTSCLIQQAYKNVISLGVKFSAATSAKGGICIKIGSYTINAPKYLSVRHPIIQMVLFADKRSEDIFSRTKSKAPRSIFNTAKRLNSFVSPNVCGADWISAKPNLESIKAGTGFELNVRESFGKSNKPNDDEPENRRCGIQKAFISVVPIDGMGGLGKTTLISQTSKHMTSSRHPLIQMARYARKMFKDMSCSINFVGPKSMLTTAKRLSSFGLGNGCGVEWTSAKLKSESLYAGMGSGWVLRENTGRSNKLTENEAQRNSAPDSCGAKHGTKAVTTTKITSASWVVATAAPHHATGNRDLLNGFVTEHDDQFVHAVDGVPMRVKARGAVVTDTMVLPDVWFVPGLKSNMVSVIQLAEQGYCVGFGNDECCIRSAGDGKIVGKAGLGKDELYKLDFLKVSLAM